MSKIRFRRIRVLLVLGALGLISLVFRTARISAFLFGSAQGESESEPSREEPQSTLKAEVGTLETDPARLIKIEEHIRAVEAHKKQAPPVPDDEILFPSRHRVKAPVGLGPNFQRYLQVKRDEMAFARAMGREPSPSYFVIQFTQDSSLFSNGLRRELERLGIRLLDYLKTNAYYAVAPVTSSGELLG